MSTFKNYAILLLLCILQLLVQEVYSQRHRRASYFRPQSSYAPPQESNYNNHAASSYGRPQHGYQYNHDVSSHYRSNYGRPSGSSYGNYNHPKSSYGRPTGSSSYNRPKSTYGRPAPTYHADQGANYNGNSQTPDYNQNPGRGGSPIVPDSGFQGPIDTGFPSNAGPNIGSGSDGPIHHGIPPPLNNFPEVPSIIPPTRGHPSGPPMVNTPIEQPTVIEVPSIIPPTRGHPSGPPMVNTPIEQPTVMEVPQHTRAPNGFPGFSPPPFDEAPSVNNVPNVPSGPIGGGSPFPIDNVPNAPNAPIGGSPPLRPPPMPQTPPFDPTQGAPNGEPQFAGGPPPIPDTPMGPPPVPSQGGNSFDLPSQAHVDEIPQPPMV